MFDGLYTSISGIAVVGYLFIFMIFLNAEKNKLINGFLTIMLAMILWTGGSLLMRQQLWPSYVFWYHISLSGLFLMVLSYFKFSAAFVGISKKNSITVYTVLLAVAFIINIPSGVFLHWPSLYIEEGRAVMVYDQINSFVAVFFVITGVIVIHMLHLLYTNVRSNIKLRRQISPVILGILLLFIGHVAIAFPIFRAFPIDILSGAINVFLIVYVLVKRKLFRPKMIASTNVGYLFCVVVGFSIFYTSFPYLESFITNNPTFPNRLYVAFYLVVFTLIVSLFLILWKQAIAKIFVMNDEYHDKILKNYSTKVSTSLNLKTIYEHTAATVLNNTEVKDLYISTLNNSKGIYKIKYSSQSLSDLSLAFSLDHPIVQYFNNNDDVLCMENFTHTTGYKSIWENEKKQLEKLKVTHAVGLKESNELVGIILLTTGNLGRAIKSQDLNLISSINTIASIAIKNAHRYEIAYFEARTDELTGALNRRYFFEVYDNILEECKEGSMGLMLINIDDFKLYNQLYGVLQGDQALKEVAEIIRRNTSDQCYVARYGGKEFALLLPQYDGYKTKQLAVSLRDQIGKIGIAEHGYRKKPLSLSVGICIYPFGATSGKELLENAEQAVYHVKRKGKNAIKIFDTFVNNEDLSAAKTNIYHIYDEYKTTIFALTATIDAKDRYTFNHSENVAKYAVALGKRLNLNQEIIENVRQAALLHDIGKIGIPEDILNKPFRLNEEEFEIMKGHVEASINIIRHLPSLDYVIPAVLGHHERYDGTGYPRRVSGEDIPLTARILCIADAFDAMISKRCYKDALSRQEALSIIERESGKQFDPELVPIFISLVHDGDIDFEPQEQKVSVLSNNE